MRKVVRAVAVLGLVLAGGLAGCSDVAELQQSDGSQSGGSQSSEAMLQAAPGVVRAGEGNRVCSAIGSEVVCHGINSEEGRGEVQVIEELPDSAVIALSLGRDFACAATGEGVWCWGSNANGELGSDVAPASATVAVRVPGLPADIEELVSGRTHSCAATGEGVWCWGSNAYGQIRGTVSEQAVEATQVITEPLEGLSSSGFETCGISHVGDVSSLVCWGNNRWGQISPLLSAETLPPTVLATTASYS